MLSVPSSHLLIRPSPLERVGVPLVVLLPGRHHVIDVFRAAFPGSALQVPAVKRVIEQFSLVEPGGTSGRQPGSPPSPTGTKILPRGMAVVAGTAVMDQVDSPKASVVPSEPHQSRYVVISIVGLQADGLHLAGMNDQEHEDVHCTMPEIVELLLLDRAWNAASDWNSFQNLAVGHLVGAHHPDPAPGQSLGFGIAPEHLLRPLLELSVEATCPPVACPMGLQVDGVENPSDRSGADRRDDAVGNRLARQILTTPVRDVQPSGQGLQASQCDDLSPLEGGKSRPVAPSILCGRRRTVQPRHRLGIVRRPSRRWPHCIRVVRRPTSSVRPIRAPERSVRVALETRGAFGSGQSAEGWIRHRDEGPIGWVFGHAWQEGSR